jgi:hypothetical protein
MLVYLKGSKPSSNTQHHWVSGCFNKAMNYGNTFTKQVGPVVVEC